MSSGLNSSHFDLTDDAQFNLLQQKRLQQQQQQQQQMAGRNAAMGNRGFSTSVFNLNQLNRNNASANAMNGWMPNPMQQVNIESIVSLGKG